MTPLADRPRSHADVSIPADGVQLGGEMHSPSGASGVVAFAHGSGSSRLSPRNRFVAREQQKGALEAVARHACRWFVRYLSPGAVRSGAAAQAHP
jgi:hypothetical protein